MNSISQLRLMSLISASVGLAVFCVLFMERPNYDKWFYLFLSFIFSVYVCAYLFYILIGHARSDFKDHVIRDETYIDPKSGDQTHTTVYHGHSDARIDGYLRLYVEVRQLIQMSWFGIPIVIILILATGDF